MIQEKTIIKYFGLDPLTTEISIKEKVHVKIEDIKNSGMDAPKFINYSFSFIESGNVVLEKELTKSEILEILRSVYIDLILNDEVISTQEIPGIGDDY